MHWEGKKNMKKSHFKKMTLNSVIWSEKHKDCLKPFSPTNHDVEIHYKEEMGINVK